MPARSRLLRVRARSRRALLAVASTLLPFACGGSSSSGGGGGGGGGGPVVLAFTPIGGAFTTPVFLTAPPNDSRLFVVEKAGTIIVVENGTQLPVPFLDITALVSTGAEQGLLGLAFDPAYASNGRFYVDYTDPSGATVIARYHVSASDPDRADPASASLVLTYPHPFEVHNGGMIAFGPDGMLYVSAGDGGDAGNGQRLDELLGGILRIDVSGSSGYTIPPDNPFVSGGGEAEIWSYGLRNPWRISFDRQTGDLYVADVGRGEREEVEVATAANGTGRGVDFGWSVLEGTLCNDPPVGCNPAGTALPDLEYDHSAGCCIIGGFVYRGTAISGLAGAYFYGDFCTGLVKSFRFVGGQVTDPVVWPASPGIPITSFGEDAAGEIYVLTDTGTVYRITQG